MNGTLDDLARRGPLLRRAAVSRIDAILAMIPILEAYHLNMVSRRQAYRDDAGIVPCRHLSS